MSEEEKRQIEEECLLNCSKAKMIEKYIYELEESSKLSELWCKSQQENQQLKAKLEMYENGIYYSSENDKLKEVIEEVREYVKTHIEDNAGEGTLFVGEVEDLLQILDKAKGNKND